MVPYSLQGVGEAVQNAPDALHSQALQHLQNARDLYLKQLQDEPPHPERHKVGLGIALGSILAAALDPTHQAGTSLYNSYKQGAAQSDDTANKLAMTQFQRQQQGLQAQSQFEKEDASRLLGDQQRILTGRHQAAQDAESKRQFDANLGVKTMMEEDRQHRQDVAALSKDVSGYMKAADSADPTLRWIGMTGLKGTLEHKRHMLGDAGWDPAELEKKLTDAATTQGPKQITNGLKDANIAAGTATKAAQGVKDKAQTNKINTLLPIEKGRMQAQTNESIARTGVDKVRQQKLTDDWAWAKVIRPLQLQKANLAITHAHQIIDKAAASGHGSTPDDMKALKAASGAVGSTMRDLMAEIKEQDGVIKSNSALGMIDPNAASAAKEAQRRRGIAQKQYDQYKAESQKIRGKLGVHVGRL
jgi:hypothetical protein